MTGAAGAGWMVTIALRRSWGRRASSDLGGLDFLIERIEGLTELRVDGFSGRRPLDENREVVALLAERIDEIAILLEPLAALEHLLSFGLVVPEVGSCGARLEPGQFILRAGGFKDNSADRRRGGRGLRIGASTRQRWA